MKEALKVIFSGIGGVMITLFFQFYFNKPQENIIDGNEVTKEAYLEVSRQKDELQNKLDELEKQYQELELQNGEQTIKYNELLASIEIDSIPETDPEPISETNYKSVSIREVKDFYSDGIEHRKNNITDNIGNLYDGYTFMAAGDVVVEPEGSVVYRNDNRYSQFYGKVIVSESEKDAKDCGWIKIFGDDILLFDSGVMGRGVPQ